jgi:hypothetical protein
LIEKFIQSWAWWYTSESLALRRLKQEDQKFQNSLGYIARPCPEREKQRERKRERERERERKRERKV